MINASDCSGKSRWQQATTRLRNVLNEPNVDLLKGNLERLKSTMLLLLNVIMYASQVRSNKVPAMLDEQRALLESLLAEKKQEQAFSSTAVRQAATATAYNSSWFQQPAVQPGSSQKLASQGGKNNDLEEYNTLIRAMFHKIDDCKSKLENTRHSRIRNGVLNIHSGEIVQFQHVHGPHIFQFFEAFEEVQAVSPQSAQEHTPKKILCLAESIKDCVIVMEDDKPTDSAGAGQNQSSYRPHHEADFQGVRSSPMAMERRGTHVQEPRTGAHANAQSQPSQRPTNDPVTTITGVNPSKIGKKKGPFRSQRAHSLGGTSESESRKRGQMHRDFDGIGAWTSSSSRRCPDSSDQGPPGKSLKVSPGKSSKVSQSNMDKKDVAQLPLLPPSTAEVALKMVKHHRLHLSLLGYRPPFGFRAVSQA